MTQHQRGLRAAEESDRHRMIILVICCLSLFIVGLDNTIVNVALPTISRGLGASVSGLQWIVDGYTMVLASLVMSAGAFADRFGRRQVFRAGLMVFTVSSGLCSIAPSLGWLIAFRVLQAIGGSMLNPVAVSIISSVFKGRAERAWAIGVWVTMFGVSMALGPVFGGVLTSTVGWRSIFWVNIPVGLVAIALVSRFIPESRAEVRRHLDLVAQLLVIVMLSSLIYAIIEGARSDWTEPGIRALFGVAGVALLVLVRWELCRTDPLIDPRSFRNVPFTGAVLTGICSFGSLGGFLFLSTIYLQEARGLSALHAGLHMLPAAAAMAICPLPAAWLAARRGLWLPLTLGGLALMLSMIAMSRLTASSGEFSLIAAFTMFGIGLGMVDGQISHAAVSSMPPSQAGLAAGVASASRQMGQALGVAVTGALLNANLHGPVRTEFVSASRPAWLVLTGCGGIVLLLGMTTTRAWLPEHVGEPAADGPPPVPPLPRPRYSGRAQSRPSPAAPPEPAPSPQREPAGLLPQRRPLPQRAASPEPAPLPQRAPSPQPALAAEREPAPQPGPFPRPGLLPPRELSPQPAPLPQRDTSPQPTLPPAQPTPSSQPVPSSSSPWREPPPKQEPSPQREPSAEPVPSPVLEPSPVLKPSLDVESTPEPEPERWPEPQWRQLPPRPASGTPTVITRQDQIYYRRQWRAGSD